MLLFQHQNFWHGFHNCISLHALIGQESRFILQGFIDRLETLSEFCEQGIETVNHKVYPQAFTSTKMTYSAAITWQFLPASKNSNDAEAVSTTN